MPAAASNLIKCACCGDDTDAATAHFDVDLKDQVCQPCKWHLRNAQANLKASANAIGCTHTAPDS